MTKEQEAIERLNRIITTKFNNDYSIDSSDKEAIETVLSMLKEKDKKIESLEKTLDKRFIYVTRARTVYGRLMQLDKESIVQDDLKRRNELNQCIKAEEKYKELYHKALGDLAKADRENIQLKKQIDLMAEEINETDRGYTDYCEMKIECDRNCKDCIKQYFERKSKE